ncbi:MAG: glutamate racemase [Anaerolineaceae bacterium]|nr:glutamate racemase [Anaerolineaceae bacterium]
MTQQADTIGVYDSGVGGLSVLREIQVQLPHEDLIYFGDQANCPYGQRSKKELQDLAEGITHFLLDKNIKLLVIACNTASAAALKETRLQFPYLPIVGMEPAVKPAASQTLTGKVGVLATPSTFEGELYASVIERFAQNVEVFESTCPGLVKQIEKGDLESPQTLNILREAIRPMIANGADTLVMGCTHYPFVIPQIRQLAGPGVAVIDPAPAVARQLNRVLEAKRLQNQQLLPGKLSFYTSGNTEAFLKILSKLTTLQGEVHQVVWQDNVLKEITKA